jgi:hypothetical protein
MGNHGDHVALMTLQVHPHEVGEHHIGSVGLESYLTGRAVGDIIDSQLEIVLLVEPKLVHRRDFPFGGAGPLQSKGKLQGFRAETREQRRRTHRKTEQRSTGKSGHDSSWTHTLFRRQTELSFHVIGQDDVSY